MGIGAGGNGNNQREWEDNWDKTRLNLGSGMGINVGNARDWECDTLYTTLNFDPLTLKVCNRSGVS